MDKFAAPLLSSILALVTALIVASWQTRQQLRKLLDERRVDQEEHLKAIVAKYSRPLLLAAADLQDRLWHLTQLEATKNPSSILLESDPDRENDPKWTMTPRHYMVSTIYLFARYFAWVEILRQEVQFLEFGVQDKQNETRRFYEKINAVQRALSGTEMRDGKRIKSDRQLFQFQQALIGQMMMKPGQDGTTCLNHAEFSERYEVTFKDLHEFIALRKLIMGAVSRDAIDFCLSRCCIITNSLVDIINLLDPNYLFLSPSERRTVRFPELTDVASAPETSTSTGS